jgi:hypothetical protein
MVGTEYHKLWAPYKREPVKPFPLIMGDWARPEFGELSELKSWTWTEKINGTNVRIIWDGHKVRIGGRTDGAQMPLFLVDWLRTEFPEELLENQFHANPAVLYGEGFGANVANGSGVYGRDPGFALFDVNVAGWWLQPFDVARVAGQMGIGHVPQVMEGSIVEAIKWLQDPRCHSRWGMFTPEGFVGKPPQGLLGRDGDRLMIKIKATDFPTVDQS